MSPERQEGPLYPNTPSSRGVSRRKLLASSLTAGAAATAGCLSEDGEPAASGQPTVFVFNTGDGTVSLIDPDSQRHIETQDIGLTASFPSNQYTPSLVEQPADSLWLNVGQGVRAVTVESFTEEAKIETQSGANWLERTPDGSHVIISAREPAHRQFRIEADAEREKFGEVTAEIDRRPEGGRGDSDGPGPCDVTIHPSGEYAYVPDLFGDTLTVLSVEPFEIVTQVEVEALESDPAQPWMGTVAPDGETLLVEHNEGETGTESIWDISDPTQPRERARLTDSDGLGHRPLTSEIGPNSEVGYVFTPATNDVTMLDLEAGSVMERLDLGGSAFVGTWDPEMTALYVPIQTSDEVAVIDHATGEITGRIDVGASPYGATAAMARPASDPANMVGVALSQLGLADNPTETTYCIGKCACGHEL
jgi:YVTN family beta-propeller protein